MATGGPDDVDVGSADTLLAGRSPGVARRCRPQEHRLKLNHSRAGEQQRRIVGNERRAGQTLATLALKEGKETLPDVSGLHLAVLLVVVGSRGQTTRADGAVTRGILS